MSHITQVEEQGLSDLAQTVSVISLYHVWGAETTVLRWQHIVLTSRPCVLPPDVTRTTLFSIRFSSQHQCTTQSQVRSTRAVLATLVHNTVTGAVNTSKLHHKPVEGITRTSQLLSSGRICWGHEFTRSGGSTRSGETGSRPWRGATGSRPGRGATESRPGRGATERARRPRRTRRRRGRRG